MKVIVWIGLFICCFTGLTAQQLFIPTETDSKIHFVIKNFGIKTGGDFSGLKGTIKFDPKNLTAAFFDVSVNASTIDTDNSTRDSHLKKEEYFYVEKFPTIHIMSTKIQATTKPGTYVFTGNLTIKGISKAISFPFTVDVKDGGYLFTGELEINRRDYHVGGSSISMADNVKLFLNVLAK